MTTKTSSTTPTPAAPAGPSTEQPAAPQPAAPPATLGETVLVRVDTDLFRPLLVSSVTRLNYLKPGSAASESITEWRINGTIFCEPDDYMRGVFRGMLDRAGDPARIEGRPSRVNPIAYGQHLAEGDGIGQWKRRV